MMENDLNTTQQLSTISKTTNLSSYLHYAQMPYKSHLNQKIKSQKEYQLSYGMDASTSSTTPNQEQKLNNYGLMEDSYYEDGLNGNNISNFKDDYINKKNQMKNKHRSRI